VTKVVVSLIREDDQYVVSVRDDGRGETASESGGRGLLGMRERAELLGGHLTAGPSGDGFEVRGVIPA
jgi:signal transduction histidine kinase